jgi:two-component system, cell cycle response regulator DivK
MTSDTNRQAVPHVLVVDHDVDTREMYAFTLARAGFRVSIAATVADALARTRLLKPDLVTADLQGGPRDCCQLTEALKASTETRSIPVIAVTGWANVDDRELALHAGCDSVLLKPCRVKELLAEIHRLLPARFIRCPQCHHQGGTLLEFPIGLPDLYFQCHTYGHIWKTASTT